MSSRNVRLEETKDWSAWDREFRSRAINMDIWEKINPDKPATDRPAFLTEPVKPDPRRYEKRLISSRQPPANSTRSASSTSGTLDEEPDPNGEPKDASEMTARGRTSYQLDRSIYTEDMRFFEKEKKAIKELKDWIGETVKLHLLETACQPEDSLETWYTGLRTQVGATRTQIYTLARTKYQTAIKLLLRPPRDMMSWLSDWEEAVSQAIAAKLPSIQHSQDWWLDFNDAINKVGYDAWCQAYQINNRAKIEDNDITFRQVSNDFAAELRRTSHTTSGSKRTIQKGAHAASFKGNQADKTTELTTSSPPSSGPSPKPTKPQRRKRKNTEGTVSGCKACGLTGHTLDKCYYTFPDKAFDKWKPRPTIAQKVEDNLKNDEELRKEVQRLKKKAKKVQFADSSSQDGQTTDTETHH